MTVQSIIIDEARRLGHVDEYQYPNAAALSDANFYYHDLENAITTEVSEDFFWNFFDSDTVVGQSEYSFPTEVTGNLQGMFKNLGVSVDYWDGRGPRKLRKVYPYLLEQDVRYYEENQSIEDPFYYVADNSVFVCPAPTVAVTSWLRLYGTQNLVDLTETTADADIFNGKIPAKFFRYIVQGMLEPIYKMQKLHNEANNEAAKYENMRSKLVEYLSDRSMNVMESETGTNLHNLSN